MDQNHRQPTLPSLLGGSLPLDFTNTIEGRDGKRPHEFLTRYADLARWSQHAGVIDSEQAQSLIEWGERLPDRAAEVFQQAMAFREALYRAFVAIAHGHSPDPVVLDVLTAEYERAIEHGRLRTLDDRQSLVWTWNSDTVEMDWPLWQIALDAVDLLRSDQLHRVKQCGNVEGCGWLFLDTSKNGSRRWCSMAACGSRIKMRRQYAKRRATLQTSS